MVQHARPRGGRLRLSLLLFLTACASEPAHEILIPADGAELGHRGLVSVVIDLESRERNDVQLSIDGRDLESLLPVTRRRISFLGGGFDYITTVDLSDLDEGTHRLRAKIGNNKAVVQVVVPERHRVDLSLVDETGSPIFGRVFVFKDGEPMDLTSGLGMDHHRRDADVSAVDCMEGVCAVFLEPGEYELLGWRGLRGGLTRSELVLTEDIAIEIAVPLEIPTPGEMSSDMHIHTGKSGDSWVPLWLRYESLAASGIDRFVITDHLHLGDPELLFDGMGMPEDFGVRGAEMDLRVFVDGESRSGGHMNVFPLSVLAEDVLPPTTTQPPAVTLASYRAADLAGEAPIIIQLNHPRGIHFRPELEPQPQWQLFDRMGFEHDQAIGQGANAWMGTAPAPTKPPGIDFDAVEVLNRFSVTLYDEVRADWFALLDQGVFIVGTGNSDSHGLSVEMAGMTSTLVRTDDTAIAPWTEALRSGHARVTSGVFVEIDLDGSRSGDIRVGGDGSVSIHVQAPSWVPVSEARLIQDGVEVWSMPLTDDLRDGDGVLDASFSVPITVAADGWIVAEAGFEVGVVPDDLGIYGKIAPGYVPVGFTNPVLLDVAGDGWAP